MVENVIETGLIETTETAELFKTTVKMVNALGGEAITYTVLGETPSDEELDKLECPETTPLQAGQVYILVRYPSTTQATGRMFAENYLLSPEHAVLDERNKTRYNNG